MENIYKIKIRTNPDPRDRYPSERRYSSSIVLGFSVLFLALSLTSTLMGTLVVRKISSNITQDLNTTNDSLNSTYTLNDDDGGNDRLLKKVEKDLILDEPAHSVNIPAMVSGGCFIMSLGNFVSALTGIVAWKHWYIDNNITWFFLSTCFSTMTSSISLLLITLTVMERSYQQNGSPPPSISAALAANIFVMSVIGVVWSVLASKVSYKGMRSSYPDDIVISKAHGRVEVSTVRKGNKIAKVIPPDILNHFPKTGKLAKYFPKKENHNLPKAESNREYEERVKKFLAGHPGNEEK